MNITYPELPTKYIQNPKKGNWIRKVSSLQINDQLSWDISWDDAVENKDGEKKRRNKKEASLLQHWFDSYFQSSEDIAVAVMKIV